MNRRERRAAARALLADLAVKIAATPGSTEPPAPVAKAPTRPAEAPAPSAEPSARFTKRPVPTTRRATARPPRRSTAPVARLRIGLGTKAGLRPADVVGAIANEAGLNARQIGAIEIAEHSTTVEVPAPEADAVVRALERTTIRGRHTSIARVP